MKGLIVKGIGGFYYVQTERGLVEARGRGIFRKQGITLCVGDYVDVSLLDEAENKGVIEEIFPRKNQFVRPPIANIDTFIIVFAASSPKPNYPVIDKFLVTAETKEIEAVICINKCDLVSYDEAEQIRAIYDKVYKVILTSSKTGEGIPELKTVLRGKKAAFAGPSGVGKSSLLNMLHPKAAMQTGEISRKTERGRHTTRHVELFSVDGGGSLFDTPGFTSFELDDEIDEADLGQYYREFTQYSSMCRYDDCRHIREPGCAVKKAVQAGEINEMRYRSYVSLCEELKNKKKY